MLLVTNIELYPDGTCVLGYSELPGDMRDNGIAMRRQITLPGELPATVDQIQDLADAAQRALEAGLSAFSNSRAITLEELEAPEHLLDDDAPGPYDNPNER